MGIERVNGRRETVSEVFAAFVEASSWSDIGPDLRHEAKRSLLNFFGCALGAANSDPIAIAVNVMRQFSGATQAGLIGRPERLDAMGASFLNAISANLLDFDDTHLDTIIHPAAPVAAPVLALAQARGFSGGCSHGIHSRRGGGMPRRQRGVSRTLCTRLAHHLDVRSVRCGRSLRETVPATGEPDFKCDRNCRQPVGRDRRKPAQRRQECQRRQCGAQRPVRGIARG